jgi:chromosome segregation ATPase
MQKDLKAFFGDHHGLDERSINALTKALEKNNLPGFDYIEFKQALGRLQELDMDEPTAFRSAFATASTVGLTKEKLLKTAEHYRKVLTTEKQQFDDSLNRQMEQRVRSKQQEVEKLKKQIGEYQAKIQQLQEKVEKAQSTIDHADEHIQDAKTKLLDTKEKFDYALQSIVNEIEKDIENVGTYL